MRCLLFVSLNAFDKKVVSKNKNKKRLGDCGGCVYALATLPIQPQTEVKMSQKHQLVLHWLSLLLGILNSQPMLQNKYLILI